ncbi:MAG: sigma-70 family RNA polymerase sigma factor [Cyanobacteriota bacterium]
MNELEERLHLLVTEACKHRAGSAQRQKNLTRIIRLVSPKLWREHTPYYQDALQQTWVYFCQNICAGVENTGAPYNAERGSVITWLNFYLKRRLQDFYIESRKAPKKPKPDEGGETLDLIENYPANPDVPPLLDEVRQWVEADADGELSSIYITDRPDVTAQVLILRRLPPETSWKDLAAEFNLSISTLSSFYQRQCLPRLRKFGETEGYL